jgi:two-component system response regulator DevR
MQCIIVEDHPLTAAGIAATITSKNPGMTVKTVNNVADGLSEIDKLTSVDGSQMFVVTDLQFPERSGLDVLRHVRATNASIHAIVVSSTEDKHTIDLCVELGACAHIMKREAIECVGLAISEICAGRKYLSKTKKILKEDPFVDIVKTMRPRQKVALDLVIMGCSNQGIADKMNIGVGTVKNYMQDILSMFDVTTRAQLMAASRSSNYSPEKTI